MMKCYIIQNGYSAMTSLCIKYGKRHQALLTPPSLFCRPLTVPLHSENYQYANNPTSPQKQIDL